MHFSTTLPDDKFVAPKRLKLRAVADDGKVTLREYVTFPSVSHISRNKNTTIVHWADGQVTPVTLSPNEPESIYTAFCAALAKRLYGSTSSVHKIVETMTDEYINAQAEAKKNELKTEQEAREQRNHKRKVHSIAKRMKLENEAKLELAKDGNNDVVTVLKDLVKRLEE